MKTAFTFVLCIAILATGCGGAYPTAVHAQQNGGLIRLYSNRTPCGELCPPNNTSYWLVDSGPGTQVAFYEQVTVNGAQGTADKDAFVMTFPNAVLTTQFCSTGSDCNTATITQGPQ